MFYTTDISVTLWILNKNKKEKTVQLPDEVRQYRNRENEILFLDLRQKGIPFEKKYTQFSEDEIQEIAGTYHTWQCLRQAQATSENKLKGYEDIPEFCYSATKEEVKAKDYSLVPSKYIAFVNRDEQIDYEDKMKALQQDITQLLQEEAQSKKDLLKVFDELGFTIKL